MSCFYFIGYYDLYLSGKVNHDKFCISIYQSTKIRSHKPQIFKIFSVRTCLSPFFNTIYVFIELLPEVYVHNTRTPQMSLLKEDWKKLSTNSLILRRFLNAHVEINEKETRTQRCLS